jgi:hypothetical protein
MRDLTNEVLGDLVESDNIVREGEDVILVEA